MDFLFFLGLEGVGRPLLAPATVRVGRRRGGGDQGGHPPHDAGVRPSQDEGDVRAAQGEDHTA